MFKCTWCDRPDLNLANIKPLKCMKDTGHTSAGVSSQKWAGVCSCSRDRAGHSATSPRRRLERTEWTLVEKPHGESELWTEKDEQRSVRPCPAVCSESSQVILIRDQDFHTFPLGTPNPEGAVHRFQRIMAVPDRYIIKTLRYLPPASLSVLVVLFTADMLCWLWALCCLNCWISLRERERPVPSYLQRGWGKVIK